MEVSTSRNLSIGTLESLVSSASVLSTVIRNSEPSAAAVLASALPLSTTVGTRSTCVSFGSVLPASDCVTEKSNASSTGWEAPCLAATLSGIRLPVPGLRSFTVALRDSILRSSGPTGTGRAGGSSTFGGSAFVASTSSGGSGASSGPFVLGPQATRTSVSKTKRFMRVGR